MNKYGPDKKELRFRIALSCVGLALLGFAIWYRGWPQGPAGFELIIFGGGFCLASIIWSLWRYVKLDD